MATGWTNMSIPTLNHAHAFSIRRALYGALAYEHDYGGRAVRGLGRAIGISFIFWFTLAALVGALAALAGK
jgi:hypothetical protein